MVRQALRDQVGAGAGQERSAAEGAFGSTGRSGRGDDERELVEEVGVRLGQAEGDPARGVVGDDPGGQVAALRALLAGWCAQDAVVVVRDTGRGADDELALDAAPEVGRPHQIAVGVADSPAECKRVRRAAVGRARQPSGQVGDEREPGRTTDRRESVGPS